MFAVTVISTVFSTQASFEANADLYAARRKHFETSLDYYSEINGFQLKRKFSLMEPLLTFMHAQVGAHPVFYTKFSFYQMGEKKKSAVTRIRTWVITATT